MNPGIPLASKSTAYDKAVDFFVGELGLNSTHRFFHPPCTNKTFLITQSDTWSCVNHETIT